MRFKEALDGWTQGRLTQAEAALLLGRHVDRYKEDGLQGLLDKRLSQISKRRASEAEVDQVVQTYKSRGQHRIKRERAPLPGMMLHQDASTHRWAPQEVWDLVWFIFMVHPL